MKREFYIILISIFIISCVRLTSNNESDLEQDISISLILVYPQRKQIAAVTYLHSNEKFGISPTFVDSASLSIGEIHFINIPNDSLKLNRFCSENPIDLNKCHNYYTNDLRIKPGKKYNLNLQYKSFRIEGETIVPDFFNVSVVGRKIFWTKNTNAYSFRITIRQKMENFFYENVTEKYSMELDSVTFKQGNYLLKIEAIDKNFCDFIINKTKRSGINNGFGVFGSVTIVEKEFSL